MPITIHPDLARGRQPRWLLDLTLAGRTWRLTDGPDVDVVLDSGTYRYLGGLDTPSVPERLDLWASDGSVVSVPISLLPPSDLDVCALAEAGHVAAAATAVLRLTYDETDADASRTVLSGRVVQPVAGLSGDPLAFALEADTTQAGEVPDPLATVDDDTWSGNGDPNVQGLRYPVIIGWPGAHDGDPTSPVSYNRGSPALWVSGLAGGFDKVLVCDRPVSATDGWLYNNTDSAKSCAVSISTWPDGRGRTVATVWPGDPADAPAEGDELWMGWPPDEAGGIANPYRAGTLTGAGDVIRWALDASGREWDRDRACDLDCLNGIRIGTYIGGVDSAGVDPWEWCQSEILPLVPVSVIHGPAGIRVVPWRYWATSTDAVLALEVGRNCERASSPVYSSDSECASRIVVSYGLVADTGALVHSLTAAATPDPADTSVVVHPLCVRSLAAYRSTRGARAPERRLEVSAPVIGDRASAGLVLGYLVHRHALPYRSLDVVVRPDVAEALDLGAVVTHTDSGFGWSAAVCHVLGRAFEAPWWRVTLARWES